MTWKNLREEILQDFAEYGDSASEFIGYLEKRRSYDPAEYQRRKAAGICVFCNLPAKPGIVACHEHTQDPRLWSKRRQRGGCGRCGGTPDPGMATCRTCRNGDVTRQRRRRNRLSSEARREFNRKRALTRKSRARTIEVTQ